MEHMSLKPIDRKDSRILMVLAIICLILLFSSTKAYATETIDLYLDIAFQENWIFDKYDVDVYFDDNYLTTMPHGQRLTKMIETEPGEHDISFIKSHDKDVFGNDSFTIESSMTYSCMVTAYSDYVSISDAELIAGIDGASIAMIDVKGYILSDALEALGNCGFVNISYYANNDSIWDESNWIVTEQSIEPDNEIDKNEEILLTCYSKSQMLEKTFVDLSVSDATALAKEIDFTIDYMSYLSGNRIDNQLDSLSEEEKKLWIVKKTNDVYDKREVELCFVYTGIAEVPNVIDHNLRDALDTFRNNEFSNVSYRTLDGSTVWVERNWAVIAQSVEAGSKVEATNEIELICDSYSNLENQNATGPSFDNDNDLEENMDAMEAEGEETENNSVLAEENEIKDDNNVTENQPEIYPRDDSASQEKDSTWVCTQYGETASGNFCFNCGAKKGEVIYLPEKTEHSDPLIISMMGDKDETVRQIQEQLIDCGLMEGPADGYFDETTNTAVTKIQREWFLDQTGTVTVVEKSILDFLSNPKTPDMLLKEKLSNLTTIAQQGDKGDVVRQIQEYLVLAEKLSGKVDGDYGKKTKAAIEELQEEYYLEKTGVVTEAEMFIIEHTVDGINQSNEVQPKITSEPIVASESNDQDYYDLAYVLKGRNYWSYWVINTSTKTVRSFNTDSYGVYVGKYTGDLINGADVTYAGGAKEHINYKWTMTDSKLMIDGYYEATKTDVSSAMKYLNQPEYVDLTD